MRSRARLALLLLLSLTTAVAMACASSGAARPTAEPKPTADQTSPRETPDPTPAETEPTADPTLPKETPHPKPAEVKSPAVVAAPIESVAIEYRASPSEEAELVVVSGLPDGCHEFSDYKIRVEEAVIGVDVRNIDSSSPETACTEQYRTVETRIGLGADIEACQVYNVEVNGVSEPVQAVAPDVECAAPEPTVASQPRSPVADLEGRASVPAPIDELQIEASEAFEPDYTVVIRSGLPNGCARFGGYTMERRGDIINVAVSNLVPEDKEVACTMVYGTVENRIPLGNDFVTGKTYTVVVNDRTKTFVGRRGVQSEKVDEGRAVLDVPYRIDLGETVTIESEGLGLTFDEVLEDSRCPLDVTCIQAGQARIQIGASKDGDELGDVQLALGGTPEGARGALGGYSVAIIALEPYPSTPQPRTGSGARYTAVLLVSEADSGRPSAEVSPVELTLRAEADEDGPRTFNFVAEIIGGPDNNKALYCGELLWDFGDGQNVGISPACVPWTSETGIQRRYGYSHTYSEAGTYTVTFEIRFSERVQLSATTEVEVR